MRSDAKSKYWKCASSDLTFIASSLTESAAIGMSNARNRGSDASRFPGRRKVAGLDFLKATLDRGDHPRQFDRDCFVTGALPDGESGVSYRHGSGS